MNPPGVESFSSPQMHTPKPPLGLAYVAASLRQAGFGFHVIDSVGEALDQIAPYPG